MAYREQDRRKYGLGFLCPAIALLGLYIFSTAFFLAKRSMPHVSSCDRHSAAILLREWLDLSSEEVDRLQQSGVISPDDDEVNGCWMERRVDSMVVIVVDALRFDFARHHLPDSFGSRLQESPSNSTTASRSQLIKFIADPPTVTMQRLKALTTGGLPTFADISGSFGGASIDEDSWVQQLKSTPPFRRGFYPRYHLRPTLAFVGDDTWVDLFPTQFDDCHPFPSFNTRDLDTVDNGCLAHLPRLMKSLGRSREGESISYGFEVIVTHFLGVDHVGHTYGPHNKHMDMKLKQMDSVLSKVLDSVDENLSNECQVVFVFGDHGMTEDGNHGGGTEGEINAALFAHFSPGCGDMGVPQDITGIEAGSQSRDDFQTINQIDLVPTISMLLGLPIPYANLGGLVPSLFPPPKGKLYAPYLAASLALNAAQVWRYFTVYSNTANALPSLLELRSLLEDATSVYKRALADIEAEDSFAFREACGRFKHFLAEATELGKRVWTRFDTSGMTLGGAVLICAMIFGLPILRQSEALLNGRLNQRTNAELGVTAMLVIFQCAVLTFSNSYIEAERSIIMLCVAIISIVVSCRWSAVDATTMEAKDDTQKKQNKSAFLLLSPFVPLAAPICLRTSELFVSGHGLDPAIRLHLAHNPVVFLPCLLLLAMMRWQLFRQGVAKSRSHTAIDVLAIFFLALCWWEKRQPNVARNGFIYCRVTLVLLVGGVIWQVLVIGGMRENPRSPSDQRARTKSRTLALWFKVMLLITVVTGPSTAASAVLSSTAFYVMYRISGTLGERRIPDAVLAALWRFTVRHAFFATGHACAFSSLQYSAAFVATTEFIFVPAGTSLFLNTFGWEILGLIMVPTVAELNNRPCIWEWYYFYQLLETSGACISVSLMRRHLMVWAVFAPRFVFAGVFLVLGSLARLFGATYLSAI